MAGSRHSRMAAYGALLLIGCVFTPTLALSPTLKDKTCPYGDYPTEAGICCNKCSPGFKLVHMCLAEGMRSNCTPCPTDQYMDQMNYSPKCMRCKQCKESKQEVQESKCERHRDTICRCKDGYYQFTIDSETTECRRCSQCGLDEKAVQICTSKTNTVCQCKENYHRVKRKCEPCKNCTTDCEHLCKLLPSHNPSVLEERQDGFFINVLVGVGAAAFILLMLVFFVTYIATKRCNEKTPEAPSLEPSDELHILVEKTEESSSNCNNMAVPQATVVEMDPSNLPDCVPLEVKIGDLINILLEMVPVIQVRPLVRSLGVSDIVIDRAFQDHYRSIREAHYQMFRAWAEMSPPSGSGSGGRSGMLHSAKLQELLHTLRKMHLGRTAEELETVYSIQ
ncbi:tumor necrosis factor receptor superfamily member 1A [Nerophis lumbriciformis]|uniref:tumor necrosis factor receptor superfamily member 1A n=1 Tax=Nerophis lumbriciformis TaxID=546530 RepID=UPI002ADF55A7|nr:tumor necrosis factor receptor superfamily member 1A-like [Nerophis lumbriciformis]